MIKIKKIIDKFLTNRKLTVVLFLVFYFAYLFLIRSFFSGNFIILILSLVLPFIIYELFLRLLLRFVYGRQYRYSLYNFFLVNHPLYGTQFRKNSSSHEADFLAFDRFVFKPDAKHTIDLEENKKQRVDFNINKLGFRGKDFLPQKDGKKVRIFCSGGSTTVCDCSDDEKTWSTLLEKELVGQGYNVEVINAGTSGWSSYQELLRFKNEIINYQPDIILLHQGWNEEFLFSSQNLGKWWRPEVVKNVIELKSFYCSINKFFSSFSAKSMFFLFLMQIYFKDIRFRNNMKFSNPRRWQCLKSPDYILAWFNNLMEFAKLASEKGVYLYTINYAGLSDFDDSLEERQIYIENSRLTKLHADYQAISKKRIQRTLERLNPIIPCLDVEKELVNIRGHERVALFNDEVHMSPKGNQLLAKLVAQKLIKDEKFRNLFQEVQNKIKQTNVNYEPALVNQMKKDIGNNYGYIDRFINNKINKLAYDLEDLRDVLIIPSEHYTTF